MVAVSLKVTYCVNPPVGCKHFFVWLLKNSSLLQSCILFKYRRFTCLVYFFNPHKTCFILISKDFGTVIVTAFLLVLPKCNSAPSPDSDCVSKVFITWLNIIQLKEQDIPEKNAQKNREEQLLEELCCFETYLLQLFMQLITCIFE